MPQFDLTWYASQMFWVVLTFSAMFLLVAGYAVPKVVRVLNERRGKIEGDLQKAEQMKAEAAHILAEYQKAIASAQDQTRKMIADSQIKTATLLKEKEKDFSDELNKKIAENEVILETERKQALSGMKNLTKTLTAEIVQKLIGADIDAKELKDKIAEAMEKTV